MQQIRIHRKIAIPMYVHRGCGKQGVSVWADSSKGRFSFVEVR